MTVVAMVMTMMAMVMAAAVVFMVITAAMVLMVLMAAMVIAAVVIMSSRIGVTSTGQKHDQRGRQHFHIHDVLQLHQVSRVSASIFFRSGRLFCPVGFVGIYALSTLCIHHGLGTFTTAIGVPEVFIVAVEFNVFFLSCFCLAEMSLKIMAMLVLSGRPAKVSFAACHAV